MRLFGLRQTPFGRIGETVAVVDGGFNVFTM